MASNKSDKARRRALAQIAPGVITSTQAPIAPVVAAPQPLPQPAAQTIPAAQNPTAVASAPGDEVEVVDGTITRAMQIGERPTLQSVNGMIAVDKGRTLLVPL